MTNLKHELTSPEPIDSTAQQASQVTAASQASKQETNEASSPSGAEEVSSPQSNSAQKPESPANSANVQNGQSTVSMAATGKRFGGLAVLPGESAEKYFEGFASTIEELGAKTKMQIYLAEKIFQCIWSMNRYEVQKRACLIAEMVSALNNLYGRACDDEVEITKLLEAGLWDSPVIQSKLKTSGYTAQSLTQRGYERRMEQIVQFDQQIASKAHTLSALQKSYEALVSRSILQERLKLQNELLKRDLMAIDLTSLQDMSSKAEDRNEVQAIDATVSANSTGVILVSQDLKPSHSSKTDGDPGELASSVVKPKNVDLKDAELEEAEVKNTKPKKAKSKEVQVQTADLTATKTKVARGQKSNASITAQESF